MASTVTIYTTDGDINKIPYIDKVTLEKTTCLKDFVSPFNTVAGYRLEFQTPVTVKINA